ncbi:MAG: bifunctional 2-C-methyl-D-erythritol 4-phosphate cytidylyltransferase/2-C-methyl-D-erythritol 2,4-cyclodiphosphate synthase [Marivibrio sp.]|uniref:bifunctional 2-C-methyl-D-erythritol 4-phosphate cytidylyltransferase/2-C-methyl-D-erythritol 2,4-cyclodiphosphate synthase n=1 Tax=Marivibrio sp. TaxID=2039719 RepID=UPI0032EAACCA
MSDSSRSTVAVLIVAAGRGVRAGGGVPKQYRPLAGVPVLRRTIEAFRTHPAIGRILVVIGPEDGPDYAAATRDLAAPPATAVGGASRQESVFNGLTALEETEPGPPDLVLIHDAARPNPPAALIERVIANAQRHGAALPALAIPDTIKRGRRDADGALVVEETVPRDTLFGAQTPQGFRFADILAAHRIGRSAQATDDAALFEAMGKRVVLVDGAWEAQKLTTEEDFARAERSLAGPEETRVGSGFDVHRFEEGRDFVTLCGVRVPHDRGLKGHSDADVGLHALTDAILGALALGDIGEHFPPSDPQWRGADSAAFLRRAVDLALDAGARIVHLDVTLICERPKLGPHRAAMRARIADIAGIAESRVSVKATTTEGLGFTGRGEGIAAQALATLAARADADARAGGDA